MPSIVPRGVGNGRIAAAMRSRADKMNRPAAFNTSLYRRNKYRNRWTGYAGAKYASAKEAKFAAELDLLVRAGEIASWRRQCRIPLVVNGVTVTTYVVDFEIRHNDGTVEFVEVKGHPTPEWKLKWRLFDALRPEVRKRVVG
jgi:hypothetical protein